MCDIFSECYLRLLLVLLALSPSASPSAILCCIFLRASGEDGGILQDARNCGLPLDGGHMDMGGRGAADRDGAIAMARARRHWLGDNFNEFI